MESPLKIITDYLVPWLRVLVAKRLRGMGMSQSKIAYLIGVTQPAVKQYLDEDEAEYKGRLMKMGLAESEIDSLVERVVEVLLNGNPTSSSLFLTTRSLSYLSRLKFCNFHRSLNPEISTDCFICSSIFQEGERESMEVGLTMIRNEKVGLLVPEVLSNMALAKPNAKELSDVMAVPGRISKIRGIPTPFSRPEWGASTHLGRLLLRVMAVRPQLRCVMNVKYDEVVGRAVSKAGLTMRKVGPQREADEREIVELVSSALRESPVDVVAHLGGVNLEPIAYVFGSDPIEVAGKVNAIAQEYAKLISLAELNRRSSV